MSEGAATSRDEWAASVWGVSLGNKWNPDATLVGFTANAHHPSGPTDCWNRTAVESVAVAAWASDCLCDGVIDYLRRSSRRAADTAGRRWEERQRTVCKISQRDSDADMLAPRLAAMRGRLKMLEWKMREQASRMESRTDIVQWDSLKLLP